MPVLILEACGGDTTETEPTQTPEPPPTQAPSPSTVPTPVPEPTSAPADPTPSSSENPILPTVPVPLDEPNVGNIAARKLARAGIRTNLIRGLTLVAPLETVLERQLMTSDEFRELLAGVFETRRDKIEGDQLLYETLGLMDPGTSLYDILLTFSTEGTLAWFDLDDERQYVVLDSEELSLSHERTYVNEYVNHLQAVNFNIRAKYEATEGNEDARLALRAILEGDSAIGEYIYATEHFTPEEQEASINEPNDAFRAALNMAPYIAIRTFVFPFAEGLDFAVQLFQAAGNWSLINQVLETPPASTEQVLHLEKYASGRDADQHRDAGPCMGSRRRLEARSDGSTRRALHHGLAGDRLLATGGVDRRDGLGWRRLLAVRRAGRPRRPRPRDGMGLRTRRRGVLRYRSATCRGPLQFNMG